MSASPRINGVLGAHEQPIKFGYDPSSGEYVQREWHGTSAAIDAQYAICRAAGARCEVEGGIACHKLVARFSIPGGGTSGGEPGEETPVDAWEFMASTVEKDILEADIIFSPALTDDDLKLLRMLIANPPDPDDGSISFDNTTGLYLFDLIQHGVRSIMVSAPSVRHTQTVSNAWTVKAALTNVRRILTTTTLQLSESIPASVLFNLPEETVKRDFGGGLAYGWMKMHPTIRTAANQKMQIEQEWQYGLWSTLLYGAAI